MIKLPEDIDEAMVQFKRLTADLDHKVADLHKEQEVGRIGLTAYLQAKALQDEVKAYALALHERIEQTLRAL